MTPDQARKNRFIDGIARRYRGSLLAAIQGMVPSREDAEDILQDVLYRFTASYDDLRSLESAVGWLFQVARNRVIDWYRKRSPEKYLSEPPAGEAGSGGYLLEELLAEQHELPERRFDQQVTADAIEEALEALPDDQRDVFIWHEIEGLSFREIAEITGVTVNTLLSRKRYAVLELRRRLKELITHQLQ